MDGEATEVKYVPSAYATSRFSLDALIGHYVENWERDRRSKERAAPEAIADVNPCIVFSRKIGVGALEIADRVAEKLNYKVADRELIEYIAGRANISEKAIAYFDERFPGYTNRALKYLFGEKAFLDTDYSRHLVSAVLAIAGLESTVFVGRGAHLILPREHVLAVRLIASDEARASRIAHVMRITKTEARKMIPGIDKGQAAFFQKVFGKEGSSPDKFDMVLNLDRLTRPGDVTDIVALAHDRKFRAST